MKALLKIGYTTYLIHDVQVKVLPSATVLVRKRADGGEEPVVDISPRKRLRSTDRLALPGI